MSLLVAATVVVLVVAVVVAVMTVAMTTLSHPGIVRKGLRRHC